MSTNSIWVKDLTESQVYERDAVLEKIQTGKYKYIPNPCTLCGAENLQSRLNERLISSTDRYGIPTRTVMCGTCGMLRADPIFRETDYSDFYKNHYRALYSGQLEATKQFFNEQVYRGNKLRSLLLEFRSLTDQVVVEVGCGAGGILKGFVGNDAIAIGCDLGASYLKVAQGHSMPVFQGSLSALRKNSADVVIYSHVLEHIADVQNELKEITRVLKNDGLLVIVVPGVYSIHRNYGGQVSEYLQGAHLNHFTRDHLRGLLGKAGFCELYGTQEVTAIFSKTNSTEPLDWRAPSFLRVKVRVYLRAMSLLKYALAPALVLYLRISKSNFVVSKIE
jgi:SAM-dependent methyltransferase